MTTPAPAEAALLRVRSFMCVAEKILDRGKQERPEFATERIGFRERVFFLQMHAERLDEIFRVVLRISTPPDVRATMIEAALRATE